MKEEEVKSEIKEIKTKGGFSALLVNNQIIRKSSSPRRLDEDEETYDEYKVRLKLVRQLEKEKKPTMFWNSRFSIKGQNYTATYVKKITEEMKTKLKEENKK